jgi:hypothetical protein
LSKVLKKRAGDLLVDGRTSKEIAENLGTSLEYVIDWIDTDLSDHLDLLARIRDEEVERSLFMRAIGYSHPEEKVFCHQGEIIKETVMKHYPPDTAAVQFWLKNKQPEKWADTKTKTEIEFFAEKTKFLNFED